MEQNQQPCTHVDPPWGHFSAKVDDKGRLKLPAIMLEYLTALQAKKVFITSLDKTTAKIYTRDAWNHNIRVLTAPGEKRTKGKQLMFLANNLGAESEIDGQARLLLPTDLRRLLQMENSTVWLEASDGAITVYGEPVYRQMLAASEESLPDKVAEFEDLELK